MRVFVDTNVWLAGRFGRGLCADLLDTLIEEDTEILLDERVHAEFFRIGRVKFRVDARTLEEADIFFRRYARVLPAAEQPLSGVPDSDDAWIIAAAVSANVELFVTGDKALLSLTRIGDMQIVDPRTAYLRLRGLA